MSELSKSREVRAVRTMGDAILRASRSEHEAGNNWESVWLYDRAKECFARAEELERIFAGPTDRYLDPDYTACRSVRPLAPAHYFTGVTADAV